MRDKKGITLITLIITIVVVLILAGIILNVTLEESGLLKRTRVSKKEYENAENKEKAELEQITNLLDNYIGNDNNIEKLTADIISFTPQNLEWNVKNVKEALDYLYNK
ncbi:MAG: hypothetical protein HFJ42_08735 [Clostridia bacterium]|nr:hypothetical protein [Clostridia bacterium]